ncbi:hypothetical protein D3C86_1108910 [compost metagenome]
MDRQDRAAARQFLLQRHGPAVFRPGNHEHVPLSRLDGGGSGNGRRHRRAGQCGAGPARGQGHHRPVPGAPGSGPGPLGLRIPVAAHVPRHACVGPQGRDDGGDFRRGPGYLGHPGQVGGQARFQAAGRTHQGEDSRLLLQAVPHRLESHAGRGADLSGPGLYRVQDALWLWARAFAKGRGREPEIGGGHPRSDRLRHGPDAGMLYGLEPGIRQAHPAQA